MLRRTSGLAQGGHGAEGKMEKVRALQLNIVKSVQVKWPKTTKIQKIILTTLGSVVVFLSLFYMLFYGYEKAYADKIFPGVSIQGIDMGGKTRVQANALLESQVARLKNQKIYINTGNENKEVALSDLGVDFEITDVIDQAYNVARTGDFWHKLPYGIKILFENENLDLSISYNDEQLNNKLNESAQGTNQEAKNATVSVNDDEIKVVAEEWGKQIDYDQFKIDLENNIFDNTNSIITLKTINIEPILKSNQVELIKDEVKKIVFPTITLFDQESNKNYYATPTEIANWVALRATDSTPLVELNETKIKDYITSFTKNTDQKMTNKKVKEKDGSIISEGQEGKALNQNKLLDDLRELLVDRKIGKNTVNTIDLVINVTPKGEEKVTVWEASPAGGGTPGIAEGKYVEINLSEQRMYLFNGSNLEGSFIVSSGKASMPTPEGTRYILAKSDRAWSAKYKLYMPYWQDMGGSYGIHELPEWPGGAKEGEAHLGIPVSHGCVRLGVGAAQTVYNWTEIGTPVFIHK